jgi:hypothetical protein
MTVKTVPEGWHTVTPRLFVAGAAKLVDFLTYAFATHKEDLTVEQIRKRAATV